MRQPQFISIVVLVIIAACGTSGAVAQTTQNTEASAEYGAYQVAHNQENRQLRVKLLAEFAAKYPNSDFLPDVYRDAYMTYFLLGDSLATIEYVDRFLLFRAKIDSSERLEALITRAKTFLAGCVDADLRTPEAYGSAKAAAQEGVEALSQLPESPDCLQPGPCRSERERTRSLLNAVDRIAESGLKGENADCMGNPGLFFNLFIDSLREQERQTPRVR
jgi:hypothetical protein